MASRPHLKELLQEDQEPFHLTTYIADKQCQLKKQPSLRHTQNLQLKKKPPTQNASFSSHFCKNACFFSSALAVDSPDYLKRSPLLSPAAGGKSPARALFLHVPARTAALLLDAATRIQKNSSVPDKPKTRIRNSGFGLLGSVFKRLTNRSRTRKLENGDDVIRWADSVKSSGSGGRSSSSKRDEIRVGLEKTDPTEDQAGISNGRLSSVWSEENKSLASSSSSSASTSGSGDLSEEENGSHGDRDFSFCLSPLSPFRFALHTCPSPDLRSPAFRSPASSPSHGKYKDESNRDTDPAVKFRAEDEEEKEQNSPVSVLDPPFGDDECEEEEEQSERHEDEDRFDLESSYAFIQRAQRQLLQRLRKFERLADLDPIELERRMEEDQDEHNFEEPEREANYGNGDSSSSVDRCLIDQSLLRPGMKRLISDLIFEEEKGQCCLAGDRNGLVFKRVCKRLDSWNNLEPNTIEMMVGIDLRGEGDEWKKRHEEVSQTAAMVELSIFAVLVDELVDELVL